MSKYAIAGVSALLLAACSFHVEVGDYSRYSGRDAAQLINERWRPVLLAESPMLRVGKATCPPSLDISDGHQAYCTTSINGQQARIRVTLMNGEPYVKGMDSIFSSEMVEDLGRTRGVTEYGIDAPVHCPPPQWRVLEPKQRFWCTWQVPGHPYRIAFEGVDADGHFLALPVPHMKTIWSSYNASHGRIELPGTLVARSMDLIMTVRMKTIRTMWPDLAEHMSLAPTSCPATVVLTSVRRTVCTVGMYGKSVDIAGWVDRNGWHAVTEKYAFWAPDLAKNIQSAMVRSAASTGDMSAIHVDCGSARAVMMVAGDTMRCSYEHGTDSGHVQVDILADGRYETHLTD